VIEGLNIYSSDECIRIEETRAHFVIRNCAFSSNTTQLGTAMTLLNVTGGLIEDCKLHGKETAINTGLIEDTIFRNNSIHDFSGVLIQGNHLVNCTFEDNSIYAIVDDVFRLIEIENCTFIGNHVHDVYEPVFDMTDSSGCIISSNVLSNVIGHGILLSVCDRFTIGNNEISNTTGGIGIYKTNNSIISGNVLNSIRVHGAIEIMSSEKCSIEKNLASASMNQAYCIILKDVVESRCHQNQLSENTYDGIRLENADQCNLTYNEIHENGGVGILVDQSSTMNQFYGNILFANEQGNAKDDGSSNQWDDGISIGNTWGDYNGVGVYTVPGLAESVDQYPTRYTSPSSGTDNLVLVYVGIICGGVIVVLILLMFVKKR
jgi:parallel beta-helix repeat protein